MGLKGFFKKAGKVAAAPVVVPAKAVQQGVEAVTKKVVFSIIRHALTAAGGGLVANGYLSGGDLEIAIGAVMTIVGVVASAIEKRKAAATLATAKASPAEV